MVATTTPVDGVHDVDDRTTASISACLVIVHLETRESWRIIITNITITKKKRGGDKQGLSIRSQRRVLRRMR